MKTEEVIEKLFIAQMEDIKDNIAEAKQSSQETLKEVHNINVKLSSWEEKFVTKDQVINVIVKVLVWTIGTLIAVLGICLTYLQLKNG